MNTWNMRDHILTITHRWRLIAACFLVASLLGWGIAAILPAPYRASIDLYVGIAPQISPAAQDEFTNLDDYKNWQMDQIETLAFTDDFLSETLAALQNLDPDWDNATVPELRQILKMSWRNAGRLHLAAEAGNAGQASQAVEIWGRVIVDRVGTALTSAGQAALIDSQLQAVNAAHTESLLHQQRLSDERAAVSVWQDRLEYMPENQLDVVDRWQLQAIVSRAADWGVAWSALRENIPPPEADPAAYLPWLDRVLQTIDADLSALSGEIAALDAQRRALEPAYLQAAERSLSLSANMTVELTSAAPPLLEPVRQPETAALVGGALGVLVYLIWALVAASRRSEP
ncbi:MAG: hypothetical protein KKD28_00800 [Chloroflexi bacterium]|nr:hypothetical protein [Chloroflexota bacterium]MBU1659994.1 hypothetical protein [Chloroflexota bacterium]